ncbi:MAG: hypothetical protein ABL949_12605 [Fimbriimonadaceae bacterium]
MYRLWIPGLLLGLIVGCGGPDYAGFYSGEQRAVMDDPGLASTIGRIELELKRDGRFSLRRLSVVWDGRWHTEGNDVKLEIQTSMGRTVIDGGLVPAKLTLKPEGEGSLRFNDGNGQTAEDKKRGVILVKSTKPK